MELSVWHILSPSRKEVTLEDSGAPGDLLLLFERQDAAQFIVLQWGPKQMLNKPINIAKCLCTQSIKPLQVWVLRATARDFDANGMLWCHDATWYHDIIMCMLQPPAEAACTLQPMECLCCPQLAGCREGMIFPAAGAWESWPEEACMPQPQGCICPTQSADRTARSAPEGTYSKLVPILPLVPIAQGTLYYIGTTPLVPRTVQKLTEQASVTWTISSCHGCKHDLRGDVDR